MQNAGFEEALNSRVDDMLDACTKCGACFTACPIAGPAGLGEADPKTVVSGVLDILRFGNLQDLAWRVSECEPRADLQAGFCTKPVGGRFEPLPVLAHLLGFGEVELIEVPCDPTVGHVHEKQFAFHSGGKLCDVRQQRFISGGKVKSDEDFRIHGG